MTPQLKAFEAFAVTGLQTRTQNTDEQNPLKAKIGPLWQQFFASGLFQPGSNTPRVVGVYDRYESDWSGAFDVTAGVQAASSELPGMKTVQVQAGKYLVFTSKGVMPQAVIAGWMQVWQHFSAPRMDVQRLYATDFEEYLAPDEVAICIGVRELG
jgi:predicted transcriptional regulator YdeE